MYLVELVPSYGTLTPSLAVTIPTESMFVTSEYVNVCAIDTFPLKVTSPVKVGVPPIFPTNVDTPDTFN